MIDIQNIKDLENILDYSFKNKDLLQEALSHPSLNQTNALQDQKNYERLELLGDSIVGFLVTEMLFHEYKKYNEGELAKIKSYLVCKDTLSEIADELGLSLYIIMTNGEERTGGRYNPSNLENALEALVGAIYLDSNIDQARIFVRKFWSQYLDELDLVQIDPKTSLQELAQKFGYDIPQYKVINRSGPAHAPVFLTEVSVNGYSATGEGNSIKIAEKNAARSLLAIDFVKD